MQTNLRSLLDDLCRYNEPERIDMDTPDPTILEKLPSVQCRQARREQQSLPEARFHTQIQKKTEILKSKSVHLLPVAYRKIT